MAAFETTKIKTDNSSQKGFRGFSAFKIILLSVCLVILGLSFLPFLPVKLAPSQNLPQINIAFNMHGAAPIVVEMEATSKLEGMLSRMKGIRRITSSSWNGGGRVTIELDKHADPDVARFEAATIIRQAWPQLPNNVTYPHVTLSRSDANSLRPFLSYTLIAPKKSIEIQQYAEKEIKPKISSIKGVYQVAVSGANPMEWQFEYDFKQLEILGVSTRDIQSVLGSLVKKESLGTALVETKSGEKQRLRVSLMGEQNEMNEEKLRSLAIKNVNGRIVYLGDVVKIKRLEAEPNGYYRINGMNTINLSITADDDANQLKLGKSIKETIEILNRNFPDKYNLQLTYDATEYIKDEINKIYFRTGLTVLLLLLFVVLTYRNFKYTLLIICSLVVNIAVAIIFYYFFKIELQLYSLAGITISLTLIIDNTIVMSDQIIYRNNKKAFLAILTATLTTVASLSVIFFMNEKIKLNLKDFAAVIIINLSISLFVALFLVPALIEKLNIKKKSKKTRLDANRRFFTNYKHKQWLVYFNKVYRSISIFVWKRRGFVILAVVLAFGLPVFLLPEKIESETKFADYYNKTLGSNTYKEKIKPHVNNALGGTWRLFAQKVYNGSYWGGREGETMLNVTASLPYGTTLAQMNVLIQRMEAYIAQFSGIKQFETQISNANRASIGIRFTKENQKNSFPHQLKSKLISKSIELGGGSWAVYGVGEGFSNDLKEQSGSYRVKMFGFNYDELHAQSEKLRTKLLEHRRIKDVEIKHEFSWYKDDYQEYRFSLKNEKLAKEDIQPYQLYSAIMPFFEKRISAGDIIYESNREQLVLKAKQAADYSLWDLKHTPIRIGEKTFKLDDLAVIEKYQTPQSISKENQQYRLCVQYEYIGAYAQGRRVLDRVIEETQKELPVGYTIKEESYSWRGWGKDGINKQYFLLALIFVIIYFCSSVLFNSLLQPLYIIFIIPVSFIGLFLTFYLFKLNFDQGGFAAFILLTGITVNANIYIVNEYNNLLREQYYLTPMAAYLKAWNTKVRPILLTIVSTILGFMPFIIGEKENFWFPLAAGTIGGLLVSFVATFLLLPLFMGIGKKKAAIFSHAHNLPSK